MPIHILWLRIETALDRNRTQKHWWSIGGLPRLRASGGKFDLMRRTHSVRRGGKSLGLLQETTGGSGGDCHFDLNLHEGRYERGRQKPAKVVKDLQLAAQFFSQARMGFEHTGALGFGELGFQCDSGRINPYPAP